MQLAYNSIINNLAYITYKAKIHKKKDEKLGKSQTAN